MRLQLLSDLHFEFHADAGREFVESLDPSGVDVLVLAGDIAVGAGIPDALALFCGRYENSVVVYVHGNHEFYGSDRETVVALTRRAAEAHRNLVYLDATFSMVLGHRFIGAPLWFGRHPMADRLKRAMADFGQIAGFESWVYDENARALRLFESELSEGDIVVTHHLPTYRSVAPRFSGHPLNPFFVCDVEDLIVERKPRLWLHGHTHCSVRYELGATTVLCNPFGYAGRELNSDFRESFFVDV